MSGVLETDGAAPILHGGDLDAARAAFPQAPEPWLDLSTGINPVPYPCPPFEASALQRLPTPGELRALKAVAAACYGAPDADHVVAAPGTQILIEMLPRLWPRATIAVVCPTYAEHAAAWARAGHTVAQVPDAAEADEAQVVVAVSPNNPDGRVLGAQRVRDLAARLHARGGLLVVDQAFADLEPPEPLPAGLPGLLLLRSFGKTYGLAGLRLGFALGEPALVRRLETALGPWAVSGPALAAGRVALADRAWREGQAQARAEDAARLDRLIACRGGRIVGGTRLFRTAAFEDGPALFDRLGRAAIHVRRFPETPSWLRFGLPATRQDWCRLSRVLKPGTA